MVGQFCSGCLVDVKARFFLGLGVHPIHSVQAPFVPLQPFVPLGALGVSTPLVALRHPETVSTRIFFHFQDSRLYSHPWQVPSLLFTLGSRWSFSCVFQSFSTLPFLLHVCHSVLRTVPQGNPLGISGRSELSFRLSAMDLRSYSYT